MVWLNQINLVEEEDRDSNSPSMKLQDRRGQKLKKEDGFHWKD